MKSSIGFRLLTSFVVVLLLSTSLVYIGVRTLNTTISGYNEIIEVQDALNMQVMELRGELLYQQARLNRFVATNNSDYRDQFNDNTSVQESMDTVSKLLEKIPPAKRAAYTGLLKNLETAANDFNTYASSLFELVDLGSDIIMIEQHMSEVGDPIVDVLNKNAMDMVNHVHKEQASSMESIKDTGVEMERLQFVLLFITLVISLVVGIGTSRAIATPLKAMTTAAQSLASGDLTITIPKLRSKDEIGILSHAFTTMTNGLRELVKEVETAAGSLASASKQLTASAQLASESASQVSGTINQIAVGTQQEVAAVSQTSDSVDSMAASIISTDQAVTEVRTGAANSSEKAAKGDNAVSEVMKGMADLKGVIETASETVAGLANKSDEIEAVVDLIAEIAEQTNMLALNAAIESARAGEHGRGFSVVADEVRRLAERSQSSTKEISTLINTIRDEINVTVRAIDTGVSSVDNMVKLADEAGSSLQEIEASVNGMLLSLEHVDSANGSVKSDADRVQKAMETISTVTEETSASSQQVSAYAEEQQRVIGEVAASAEELADMAGNLASLVAKFKI